MKTLLMTVGLALSYTASAQWMTKVIDNKIDPKYKTAHTDPTKRPWLKLEDYKEGVAFYIGGIFVCGDAVDVDISFMVDGEWVEYKVKDCVIAEDNKAVFFTDNLEVNEMLPSFISSSLARVRIYDTRCSEVTHEFNMTNGSSAFNFIDQD